MPQALNKTSKEILIDLIAASNPLVNLTLANFSHGPVTSYDSGRNSRVTIWRTNAPAKKVEVFYNRLAMDELFGDVYPSIEIPDNRYVTVGQLVTFLNVEYELGISEDDVALTTEVGTGDGYPKIVTVSAKPTSLCYMGSFDITITDPNATDLDEDDHFDGEGGDIDNGVNATLEAPLVDSDGKLWYDDNLNADYFRQTRNQFMTVALRARDPDLDPVQATQDNGYVVDYTFSSIRSDDGHYRVDYVVAGGREDQPRGPLLAEYAVQMKIECDSNPDTNLIFQLVSVADEFRWVCGTLSLVAQFYNYVGYDVSSLTVVEGSFDMSTVTASDEFAAAFPDAVLNINGTPMDRIAITINADRITDGDGWVEAGITIIVPEEVVIPSDDVDESNPYYTYHNQTLAPPFVDGNGMFRAFDDQNGEFFTGAFNNYVHVAARARGDAVDAVASTGTPTALYEIPTVNQNTGSYHYELGLLFQNLDRLSPMEEYSIEMRVECSSNPGQQYSYLLESEFGMYIFRLDALEIDMPIVQELNEGAQTLLASTFDCREITGTALFATTFPDATFNQDNTVIETLTLTIVCTRLTFGVGSAALSLNARGVVEPE